MQHLNNCIKSDEGKTTHCVMPTDFLTDEKETVTLVFRSVGEKSVHNSIASLLLKIFLSED